MTQEGFRRRFIALVVVVALHFVLLMLWVLEPIYIRVVDDAPSSALIFIESPRAPTTPLPAVRPSTTPAAPIVVAEPSAPGQTSVAPSTAASPPATIDWTAQAAEAAAAVVDKAISAETRKCDPSESPDSFLPPCNPRTKKFEWNPESRRVGFSGGLPFVRIGERCVVGLGFFGCGFGAPPPANGDLFEGMDDPERDRSSVPSPEPAADPR